MYIIRMLLVVCLLAHLVAVNRLCSCRVVSVQRSLDPQSVILDSKYETLPAQRLIRWSTDGSSVITDYGISRINSKDYPEELLDPSGGKPRLRDYSPDDLDANVGSLKRLGIKFSGADWLQNERCIIASLSWKHKGVSDLPIQRLYRISWLGASAPKLSRLLPPNAETTNDVCPAIEPGGRHVAFLRADGIGILDLHSGKFRSIKFADVVPFSPAWSPRGHRFLVSATQRSGLSSHLWLIDADNGSTRDLGTQPTLLEGCWSASGDSLIFSDPRLTAYSLRTKRLHNLGSESKDSTLSYPTASPNGKYLAYVKESEVEDKAHSIILYEFRTRKTRTLRTIPLSVGVPRDLAWNPRSSSLAFWITGGTTKNRPYFELVRLMVLTLTPRLQLSSH